jgi:hypothetical protein
MARITATTKGDNVPAPLTLRNEKQRISDCETSEG